MTRGRCDNSIIESNALMPALGFSDSYLRAKLGEAGSQPLIRTIRRIGYTARIV
jgi:DNA-binding winged helix-turn-helix (wHTH) protein